MPHRVSHLDSGTTVTLTWVYAYLGISVMRVSWLLSYEVTDSVD